MTVSSPLADIKSRTRIPTDPIWRLSVEQYHAMIRSGILTDDDRVELLDGMLVEKMPKNPAHSLATRMLRKFFESVLREGWFVDGQEPLTLGNSEPEPDLMLVRGKPEDYRQHHPRAADVGLVIEVSDSTLSRDRGTKLPLYAEAGIPALWIVNLPAKQIEVYGSPILGGYRDHCDYAVGEEIPVALLGQKLGTLAVGEVLA